MKKILLGLFLVFSFFSFFSFSPIASATGFEDVDWTVPMTSTAQARLRIGVANFSKVWAYKATMTNGEVTGLSLVCQYASSSNGVNPTVKECTTFINNDNINLVLVAFSNNANAGVIADLLPGSGGVFALSDDVFYPRIISASVLAPGAIPTIAQLIPEINYGFPVLPQDPIAQNGDPGWNYLPLGPDSAWIGAGLPVPAEPGHYIVKLIKNAGAGGSSGVPTLDFKANGQTSVTLTSAPSATNPVNLTWTATGVSSCTATTTATPAAPAVWTGTKTTSGTFALTNLAASTNYVLKTDCSDSMGNHVIKTVSITTAPPASTVTLTSSDSDNSVLSTETFTLSWSSTGTPAGDSCSRSSTPAVSAWTLATAPDAGGPITIGPLTAGSYAFKVECSNPAGVTPPKASATLTINVANPVASVVFNPATLPTTTVQIANGTATAALVWTPTNANNCSIASTGTPSGPAGTTNATNNNWSGTFTAPGDYSYTVTCQPISPATGSPVATGVVHVMPDTTPPFVSVNFTPTATPTINILTGSAATLSWTSSGVGGTCSKTYSVNGVSATAPASWAATGNTGTNWSTGNLSAGTYAYTITCNGSGVASSTVVSDTATVIVANTTQSPVSSVTFTAPVPTSVQTGENITLNWTSNNTVANSCDRTGGFGTWATANGPANSGVTLTSPAFSATGSNSYTFTITCDSVAGATTATATASITVTVFTLPGGVTFVNITAIPDAVQIGQESILKWNSSGVTGVCSKTVSSDPSGLAFPANWASVSGNSGPLLGWLTGSFTTAGKYKYIITCTKPDGNAISAFAEVTVTAAAVPVSSVTFTAPVPTSVQTGENITLNWTSNNTVANSCDRTGGFGTWATANGPANGSVGVVAPSVTGSYTFTITCDSVAGATQPTATASVVVNVQAIPVAKVAFKKTAMSIDVGTNLTLEWTSSNVVANSCDRTGGFGTWATANGPANGSVGVVAPSVTGPYTFTITCDSVAGATPTPTVSTSVTIQVQSSIFPAPPFVDISASPMTVDLGQSSKINWSVTGAVTSCTKTGPKNWKLVTGNNSTPPGWTTGSLSDPGTATYTFSCTGPGGSDTKSVTVTWLPSISPAAPTVSIGAKPMIVDLNKTSLINWSVTGAVTSCTKTGPKNWKLVTGNNSTPPGWTTGSLSDPGTATYTFSCTGPGGSDTKSVTVTWLPSISPAAPKITVFSASPNPVPYGNNVTITWNSTGTTSCTKTNGVGTWTTGNATSGTWTTGAPNTFSSTNYSISCTGPGGTVSKFLKVSVLPKPVITSFTASPNPVPVEGGKTTLAWSSTNATSCDIKLTGGGTVASGLGANSSWQSGQFFYLYSPKTYVLTCTGAIGTAPATATVTVPIASPQLSVNIWAVPPSVSEGGVATIYWNSSNASSCTKSGPFSGTNNALSGSLGTAPLYVDKVFSITCTGVTGAVPTTLTKSVTVMVN